MPEYLVSGHIWYRLSYQQRVTADSPDEATERWHDPPLHFEFEIPVGQLEHDDAQVDSVTLVEAEPGDLCPHCGAGADVYDSSYCENCSAYRDADTQAYCEESEHRTPSDEPDCT